MSLDQAKSLIENAGLKYEVIGSGTSVVNQIPSSGSRMSKENGKIFLYTEDIEENLDAIVPNVIGMTAEKANKALTDAGLNVRLVGATLGSDAIVYAQSIDVGSVVSKGTIVEIEMRYVGIYGDE